MHDRKLRQVVGLHQREGRARHLDRRIARQIADKRPREHRLAGAEVARERDEVARLQCVGDVDHQPACGVLVRQRHREARGRARRGQQHRHDAALNRSIAPATDATPSPPPLAGEGVGRGHTAKIRAADPLPTPPPQAGEGAERPARASSRRGPRGLVFDREHAGHGGAAADRGFQARPCRHAAPRRSARSTGRGRCRGGAIRANGSRTNRTPCPDTSAGMPGRGR